MPPRRQQIYPDGMYDILMRVHRDYVDNPTQRRILRRSARWYRRVVAENAG